MGNKSKKHQKKSQTESIVPDFSSSVTCVEKKHRHRPKPIPKPQCGCEQLFYSPLPNLAVRPPTERVAPVEWFAPGSVQVCCSLCSSVKPTYASPCTGYCCNNNY